MANLVPEYLDMDFATFISSIKTQMGTNAIFADYDYEGSNIAVLIELCAYLGDLHTFMLNKIAKNVYMDTADIYENVHRLAKLIGYNPKGHRSARTTLTITLNDPPSASGTAVTAGDTYFVDAWKALDSSEAYDGDTISFSTTTQTTSAAPSASAYPMTIDVPMRQGTVTTLSYVGSDIIDNLLLLPLEDYGYDNDIDDTLPTIDLRVNGSKWYRVNDIYDEISSVASLDNVYMFRYNKYKQYIIEFSDIRSVPEDSDEIDIIMIESIGVNGSVGSGTIATSTLGFLQVIPLTGTKYSVPIADYSITNTTSLGANDPEDIDEIKENATSFLHTQYRNVTKIDYISNLESRSDITVANVWGEQEIAPSGNTEEYNKVYISLIPYEWSSSTINTSAGTGDYDGLQVPTAYADAWETTLELYLEPYKMLCTFEEFTVPTLIYFSFDIGLRVKSTYTYADVMEDTRSKLIYYFDKTKREFGETIKFTDIENYLVDDSEVSSTNDFEDVKGIQNLVIRNIGINVTTYEPNDDDNYPQYAISSGSLWDENSLRYIVLRYDQFPSLNTDNCTFTQET